MKTHVARILLAFLFLAPVSAVAAPTIASLTLESSSTVGGSPVIGTVRLSAPAPAGGYAVRLSSSSTAVASVVSQLTIPSGSVTASFTITTVPTNANLNVVPPGAAVTITASSISIGRLAPRNSVNAVLRVVPPSVTSIASWSPVTGSQNTFAVVRLNGPAAADGSTVLLSSSHPSIVPVPQSVKVPAGQTTYAFAIETGSVAAPTTVVLTAQRSVFNVERCTITVVPPTVSMVTVSPYTVSGGDTATCRVWLTGKVAQGAQVVVALSSANASAASLPASIVIPAGSRSGSVRVQTHHVAQSTSSLITATHAGTSKSRTLGVTRPVWRFTVLAAISKQTAHHYGGFNAARQKILTQMDTVNARFNHGAPLNGTIRFVVDSVYEFDGSALNEVTRSHSKQDFKVVYDGYPTQGGGWYGAPYQTIHHSWSVTNNGGPFGSHATDGLIHEFGHSRGAVDLYALNVSAANNPINGQAYSAGTSIMHYPYGIRTWDKHSIALINKNTDRIVTSHTYITSIFPSAFKLRLTKGGQPAGGATYSIHPVVWYSNSVNEAPSMSGTIASNGATATLSSNPFRPNSSNSAWDIRYGNLLIKVQYMSYTAYRWLPLDSVQLYALSHPGASYTINIDVSPSTSPTVNVRDIRPILMRKESGDAVSSDARLEQNRPNPFNAVTMIDYTIGSDDHVSIRLYDVHGRELETIVDEKRPAGSHTAPFDGSRLPNGTYYYRLTTSRGSVVRQMVITR